MRKVVHINKISLLIVLIIPMSSHLVFAENDPSNMTKVEGPIKFCDTAFKSRNLILKELADILWESQSMKSKIISQFDEIEKLLSEYEQSDQTKKLVHAYLKQLKILKDRTVAESRVSSIVFKSVQNQSITDESLAPALRKSINSLFEVLSVFEQQLLNVRKAAGSSLKNNKNLSDIENELKSQNPKAYELLSKSEALIVRVIHLIGFQRKVENIL